MSNNMKFTWMRTCTRSGCCSTNRTYVKQQRTLQNKKNKNNNINMDNKHGPFRFSEKNMELKKMQQPNKNYSFPDKIILTWRSSGYCFIWTWRKKSRLVNCTELKQIKLCIWILSNIIWMIKKNGTILILFLLIITKYPPGGPVSPSSSSHSVWRVS